MFHHGPLNIYMPFKSWTKSFAKKKTLFRIWLVSLSCKTTFHFLLQFSASLKPMRLNKISMRNDVIVIAEITWVIYIHGPVSFCLCFDLNSLSSKQAHFGSTGTSLYLSPETKGSVSQNGVVLAAPQVVPLFGDVALGEAEDALSNKLINHTPLRDGTRIQNIQTIRENTYLTRRKVFGRDWELILPPCFFYNESKVTLGLCYPEKRKR